MKEILSLKDFKEVIEQSKPVLLDFYADWCGPCQSLLPTLDSISDELKGDAIVAKINVDKHPDLAAHFKVRSIPSLFFMKDGEVKDHLLGLQMKSTLVQKLDEIGKAA
ncbi:MAG: thioredoxin [Bacteroidia bacterium]|nr:thioredoxin [Bacteroidia bacterium]